ncbi:ABC transporter ATP-binding protein [Desulforhopalus singaporensis]|uniref:Branched-chain amino acid transport system ATP-binding protein n=1 Tax=Desulforhopalus singaporensis TaxID=91360 RepID=A0A1H0U2V0_9BACT|nr:ABC transporter ATP-binding protein [Desulforhopalus singaporensis]SDP60471.1 branched-chain amino acid transport system ATP-binding protein [Desulforhopalus singaporensis]
MIVLETKELTKRFGGLTAVNAVSMHINEGDIVGLIGPNGAGKTTLVNAIAGLNPPTSGEVITFGQKTTGLTPEKMCRKGLSRTFQIPIPFPKMTVLQNVMTAAIFGNRPGVIKDHAAHSRKMLEFVDFPIHEDTVSEQLNTVQLKRLDLARALASNPKLLFLDELASGLSEGELKDMMELILKIRDHGVTILMIEHIMQLIMNLCNRLVCIQFGTKIAEGTTEEVANDPKVTKAYLGGSGNTEAAAA